MQENDADNRLYGVPDDTDKPGQQPGGMRGEETGGQESSRPELRHEAGFGIVGTTIIKETSGVAYVDVIGTAGQGRAPEPEPIPEPAMETEWAPVAVVSAVPPSVHRSPALFLAVFATGVWIGSRRWR